jgi:uncharacterized membrane protein
MLRTSIHGFLITMVTAYAALLMLQQPAYSIERMECGGTEPFWDAILSDRQVTFNLLGDRRTVIYPAPRYRAAEGASMDFVMSVRATKGKSSLIGFVVNEALKTIADKKGKPPADPDAYRAYCSDGMSERGYPFSLHLFVDGNAYTGCCSTTASPPVGEN